METPDLYINSCLVIYLGQICLQHETEAKQTIPVLSRELEISSDPQIKRSIVIILCDLCKL